MLNLIAPIYTVGTIAVLAHDHGHWPLLKKDVYKQCCGVGDARRRIILVEPVPRRNSALLPRYRI
jgi:hypothetical protein